jgi:hypothetical protein
MRDLIGPILGAIVFVAAATAIILCFCLVLGSYAHADRRDPNSRWLVISSRYRRLALAMATTYVIGVCEAHETEFFAALFKKRGWT